MKKSFIPLLLLISCLAQAQVKQRSTTRGFNAAAGINTMGWASKYFEYLDKNSPMGFGGGIRVGYGITELIEPYLAFDFSSLGTSKIDAKSFRMNHLDIGVRANFAGTVHPVRPFVEGGLTYFKASVKQVILGTDHRDVEFFGFKPHLGGGISYFPKTFLSLFAKGIFTIGKKSSATIDKVDITDKPDVTTFRISAGVNFNLSEIINN